MCVCVCVCRLTCLDKLAELILLSGSRICLHLVCNGREREREREMCVFVSLYFRCSHCALYLNCTLLHLSLKRHPPHCFMSFPEVFNVCTVLQQAWRLDPAMWRLAGLSAPLKDTEAWNPCLSSCQSVSLSVYPSVSASLSLSLRLPVCLSSSLSLSLST